MNKHIEKELLFLNSCMSYAWCHVTLQARRRSRGALRRNPKGWYSENLWKQVWIFLNSGKAFPQAKKEEENEVFWSHTLDFNSAGPSNPGGGGGGGTPEVAAPWVSSPPPKPKCQG